MGIAISSRITLRFYEQFNKRVSTFVASHSDFQEVISPDFNMSQLSIWDMILQKTYNTITNLPNHIVLLFGNLRTDLATSID